MDPKVIDACLNVLNNDGDRSTINKTLITLVWKVKTQPECLIIDPSTYAQ